MAQDPFQSAESDALDLLTQCRPLLQDYLRIRSTASSATAPELVETRQELEATLTDLSADLQDLVDAVRAVEGDPARYGLSQAEVNRRRKLVGDIGAEVEAMRQRVKDGASEANRKRSASLAHPSTFDDTDPLAGQADDDGFAEWEEQRQMEIMQEQDEALDGVFKTVGNLRAQADTMGRELEEQAILLEDTDEITDRVGGKLARGMKGIRYVIEKNEDKWSSCCIGVLIFVLILLLAEDAPPPHQPHLSVGFANGKKLKLSRSASTASKESFPGCDVERSWVHQALLPRGHNADPTGSHPLLQQTPLSVNPFIDLPKPPTLPPNYATLPSTLPPSSINAPPAPSNPQLSAYVTSASGFAAHPSTIIAQNKALLEQLQTQSREAQAKVQAWEKGIQDRELAEKRRKAPGWLDSDARLLEPAKAGDGKEEKPALNLMDDPPSSDVQKKDAEVDDLGAAMDKAFGRSEMGG